MHLGSCLLDDRRRHLSTLLGGLRLWRLWDGERAQRRKSKASEPLRQSRLASAFPAMLTRWAQENLDNPVDVAVHVYLEG